MKSIRVLKEDIDLTPEQLRGLRGATEEVFMDDTPITDSFDLWRALDAAEKDMLFVINETNKYKYLRESQGKACKAIFSNLKKLVMDYANENKPE